VEVKPSSVRHAEDRARARREVEMATAVNKASAQATLAAFREALATVDFLAESDSALDNFRSWLVSRIEECSKNLFNR
jgi:hypothetical protein